MKKNLLFDMGNVLIRFDPALFIARRGFEGADADRLYREIFHSVEWVSLDRGDLTDDEALARILPRLPAELHEAAEDLVRHWEEPYTPMAGMPELLEALSAAGYGLYLLTNAALRHSDYWPATPLAPYFGGRIMLSAAWRLLKPESAFYEKALDLFGLDRRECLFIDDSAMNVEAAARLRLDGIVFHGDSEALRRDLAARGVLF